MGVSILKEIQHAQADCHMRTGDRATNLYLGRSQISRLRREQLHYRVCKIDFNRRLEVMGLLVYEVDDEDHCVAA